MVEEDSGEGASCGELCRRGYRADQHVGGEMEDGAYRRQEAPSTLTAV